ncbi:MAG: nucleotidyltransferase family protein [Terriglobia bacterium]|jgi:hypothetical protein
MSPEDELCLLLARAQLSPEARERTLSLLACPLQWPLLLERARIFEVFPLLYAGLRTLDFSGVPDPVRSEWTTIFRFNAIRNEILAIDLARILRMLADAGVPVIPLKGIGLAKSLYGDAALRACADLDILIPSKNVAEAFHLLLSSGYEPEFTQPRLLHLVARYGRGCTMMTPQNHMCSYALELHCGLVWGGPLERELLEEIWSDAARKSFCGVPTFALSAEWEFLYLAVHASRHGGPSLKWLIDLDRLCSRGAIDWEKVSEKAKWLGWEEAVRSCLAACAALFDTPINPAFGLKTPRGSGAPRAVGFPSVSEILFSLRLLKTPTRRLHYLAIHLFIPTLAECEFLPLPDSLFFLYYALRPFRIACQTAWWFGEAGIKSLWRALRRRAANAE